MATPRTKYDFSDLAPDVEKTTSGKLDFSDLSPEDGQNYLSDYKKGTDKEKLKQIFLGQQLPLGSPLAIAAKDVLSSLSDLASSTKNEFWPSVGYGLKHPYEYAKNVSAAGAKSIEDILNIPRNLPLIAEHFGLAGEGQQPLSQRKFDFAKYITPSGEEDNPELQYMRQAIGDIPIVGGTGMFLKGSAKRAAQLGRSLVKEAPPELTSEFGALKNKIEEHKANQDVHEEELAAKKEALNKEEAEATQKFRIKDPEKLVNDVFKKEGDIKDIDSSIENLNNTLNAIDEQTSLTPQVKQSESRLNEAASDINQAKNDIETSQNLKDTHEQSKEQLKDNLATTVNSGNIHEVDIGRKLYDSFEKNEEDAGQDFEDVKTNAKDKNISIENNDSMQSIFEDISKLNRKVTPEQTDEIAERVKNIGKNKEIPASDIISLYQNTNFKMREAYKKASKTGISEEERTGYYNAANEYKTQLQKISDQLKSVLGEEDFNKFLKARERWKNEVASLYNHPVYKSVYDRNKKRVPSNLLKEISGDDQGSQIIKGIIKKDPELIKSVVGLEHDKAPESFLKKSNRKLIQEYSSLHPQINDILTNYKNMEELTPSIESNIKTSQNKLKQSQDNYKKVESAHNELLNNHKIQQERIESSDIERKKLQENIEQYQKEKREAQQEIEQMRPTIERLRKAKEELNISLSEKMKRERQFKEMKRREKELTDLIIKSNGKLTAAYKIGKRLLIKTLRKSVGV